MVINPTYLAQRTRQCEFSPPRLRIEGVLKLMGGRLAINWNDAHRRVLKSYREWIRAVRCPRTPCCGVDMGWIQVVRWGIGLEGGEGHGGRDNC
jgi:hypothetical protein